MSEKMRYYQGRPIPVEKFEELKKPRMSPQTYLALVTALKEALIDDDIEHCDEDRAKWRAHLDVEVPM